MHSKVCAHSSSDKRNALGRSSLDVKSRGQQPRRGRRGDMTKLESARMSETRRLVEQYETCAEDVSKDVIRRAILVADVFVSQLDVGPIFLTRLNPTHK